MRRQLALKQPHLQGEDVKEVQHKLGLKGKAVDGFYGPDTAFCVMEWKWKNGYPKDRINSILGLPGLDAHIEIRRRNEGGHVFENMLDPLPFFK